MQQARCCYAVALATPWHAVAAAMAAVLTDPHPCPSPAPPLPLPCLQRQHLHLQAPVSSPEAPAPFDSAVLQPLQQLASLSLGSFSSFELAHLPLSLRRLRLRYDGQARLLSVPQLPELARWAPGGAAGVETGLASLASSWVLMIYGIWFGIHGQRRGAACMRKPRSGRRPLGSPANFQTATAWICCGWRSRALSASASTISGARCAPPGQGCSCCRVGAVPHCWAVG